jgi:chromosome segregation ATPase
VAEIKQKVSLQFETDLEQAREDVTKLGELFEQSTKPTAEQGALSAEQKAALEGEIGQRAADIGLNPEEVKQVLSDINQLKQEARSIDQQNLELEQENIALQEKAKLAKEDELAALARAANLLKLPADASREEIELARQKLKTSKDLNISEKERKELNAAINQEFRTAQGALKRQNNALVAQQRNVEAINENTNKQGGLVDRARKFYLKLTKSVEERDTVEGKVTKEIVNQRLELGKNQKAVKAIEDQTRRNEKAEREYGDAIRNTPDSFGGKVTSAFLYFQALTAIKRVAREAVRTITELDKALTDISVVTTMTRQQT